VVPFVVSTTLDAFRDLHDEIHAWGSPCRVAVWTSVVVLRCGGSVRGGVGRRRSDDSRGSSPCIHNS
jgi:hypothetical protein